MRRQSVDRYKYCNNNPLALPAVPLPGDVMRRVPDEFAFGYELRDRVVMVVLRSGNPARRWRDATRLHYAALRGLDPAAIVFVEFNPVSRLFSLLHLRWSERLWSYCYSGATVLSEDATMALGLRTKHWQRELAYLMRAAEVPV